MNRWSTLLPLSIVGLVVIMIVPISPWFLDVLLAINITTAEG